MNLKSVLFLLGGGALTLMPQSSTAAVKIGNLSRANKAQAYQQVNESRYQADLASQQAAAAAAAAAVPQELPIAVSNSELAEQIQSGQSDVSVEQLNKCSMIYPNGEFAWAKPTAGRGTGGATTCVAVVEMRAAQAGPNGEDLVVARANLAAGDSINCNISAFPQHTWLPDAANVEFPADAEPTKEDVIAVMNEEQKQHAGLKILAGGLAMAVAGNAMGKNDVGKDGVFGTSKSKLKSTAIAALGGAGVMAASSFGGKVAGDMIMSAGVNAAAGALVGNMSGKGDSALRVEKCVIEGKEQNCVYGALEEQAGGYSEDGDVYVSVSNSDSFMLCSEPKDESTGTPKTKNCKTVSVASGSETMDPEAGTCGKVDSSASCTFQDYEKDNFSGVKQEYRYCYKKPDSGNGEIQMVARVGGSCGEGVSEYIKLKSAGKLGKRYNAMLAGVDDKAFGWKKKDFEEIMYENYGKNMVYKRDASGKAEEKDSDGPWELGELNGNTDFDGKKYKFVPITIDAADGGLIDLDNKARAKSTLVGAGAGAGLGAFTAYQGAQSDIEERFVAAQREYKDSLTKFYCITGKRFLMTYNEMVTIPNMPD